MAETHGFYFPADTAIRLLDDPLVAGWLDPKRASPGADAWEMRYAEWSELIGIARMVASQVFDDVELARSQLFRYAQGGGFGVPVKMQDALLNLLTPLPTATNAIDTLRAVLIELRRSQSSLDRLAHASTYSMGENTWVSEMSFHATALAFPNHREVTRGGISRIDLFLNECAVEFKSQHSVWALKASDAARDDWWGPDLVKLAKATVPGALVISTVTLTGSLQHLRPGYRAELSRAPGTDGRTHAEVQEAGLESARRFLTNRGATTDTFDLGAGHVPGPTGDVLLGCVVGVPAS